MAGRPGRIADVHPLMWIVTAAFIGFFMRDWIDTVI